MEDLIITETLHEGWLGSMYQGKYQDDYVRLYDIRSISSSLHDDLLLRIQNTRSNSSKNIVQGRIEQGFFIVP